MLKHIKGQAGNRGCTAEQGVFRSESAEFRETLLLQGLRCWHQKDLEVFKVPDLSPRGRTGSSADRLRHFCLLVCGAGCGSVVVSRWERSSVDSNQVVCLRC